MFLLFVTHLAIVAASAQVNPHNGYIITNSNDTIYGTIDYQTDIRNAKVCVFQKSGDTTFKEYFPSEINGYRSSDNGIYYVSKFLVVGGEEKQVFLEFLVQGGLSLYRFVDEDSNEKYLVVDKEGKVAEIKKIDRVINDRRALKATMQQVMKDALPMFGKSEDTQNDLLKLNVTKKQLSRIVKNYDMNYCQSDGDCVTFEYDESKTRNLVVKLRIDCGLAINNNVITMIQPYDDNTDRDYTLSSISPVLGIGGDFHLPKITDHLYLQLGVSGYSFSKTKEFRYWEQLKKTGKISYLGIKESLGVVYSVSPKSLFSPAIKGGLNLCQLIQLKSEGFSPACSFEKANTAEKLGWGFFINAGGNLSINNHILGLFAGFERNMYNMVSINSNLYTIQLSFTL